MAYTPTNWQTGDLITAEKLNKIENGIESAGGSDLPEVTEDDNGDVLTVVEGAWAKATPTGGGDVFVVHMDIAYPSFAVTCDKTISEIKAAYDAGKGIMSIVDSALGRFVSTYCHINNLGNDKYSAWIMGNSFDPDAGSNTYGGYVVYITVDENGATVSSISDVKMAATITSIYSPTPLT